MKKTLFILLTLMLFAFSGSVYAKESFTGKVTYSYNALKVPSRISIVMVPSDKKDAYTEADVCGIVGDVFNTRGEKTLEIIPKDGTESGDYSLIVMISGEKSIVELEWLTEEDRLAKDTVDAINEASYQELYDVINNNLDVMPESFTLSDFEKLHKDYQTNVMKRLSVNYTFRNLREFEEAFNEEVNDELTVQKKAQKKPSSGGGGGGGGGSSIPVSMPAIPIKAEPETEDINEEAEFSDLGGFDWAKGAIYALSKKNIVSGTGDGAYEPERRVTRAEFSTMLVKLMDAYDEGAAVAFEDVEKDSWYYPYVASAKSKGYINGRSDSIFAPDDSITRYEAVIMVYNVLKSNGYSFGGGNGSFNDIDGLSENIRTIISDVCGEGIVVGKAEGLFFPYDSTTRAEAAVIINRLAGYIK